MKEFAENIMSFMFAVALIIFLGGSWLILSHRLFLKILIVPWYIGAIFVSGWLLINLCIYGLWDLGESK